MRGEATVSYDKAQHVGFRCDEDRHPDAVAGRVAGAVTDHADRHKPRLVIARDGAVHVGERDEVAETQIAIETIIRDLEIADPGVLPQAGASGFRGNGNADLTGQSAFYFLQWEHIQEPR